MGSSNTTILGVDFGPVVDEALLLMLALALMLAGTLVMFGPEMAQAAKIALVAA